MFRIKLWHPPGLFYVRSSNETHSPSLPASNNHGPENLDHNGEVGMSTDSSFQDQTQGSIPSVPEPGTDEPMLDHDDPKKYDPLKKTSEGRPGDWTDPGERTTPEADEEAPLSDDMR